MNEIMRQLVSGKSRKPLRQLSLGTYPDLKSLYWDLLLHGWSTTEIDEFMLTSPDWRCYDVSRQARPKPFSLIAVKYH